MVILLTVGSLKIRFHFYSCAMVTAERILSALPRNEEYMLVLMEVVEAPSVSDNVGRDSNKQQVTGPIPSMIKEFQKLWSLWVSHDSFNVYLRKSWLICSPQRVQGQPLGWVHSRWNRNSPPPLPSVRTLFGYSVQLLTQKDRELNGNHLSGAIPPELGNLSNLEMLYEGPILVYHPLISRHFAENWKTIASLAIFLRNWGSSTDSVSGTWGCTE